MKKGERGSISIYLLLVALVLALLAQLGLLSLFKCSRME